MVFAIIPIKNTRIETATKNINTTVKIDFKPPAFLFCLKKSAESKR